MDEQRAIQLCVKHQDPVGFEFLVHKYRREAYVHAYALLGNEHDALDACQDAFAKAFQVIPGLRELPRFYPWFYCILRNRCLNLLARRATTERYRQQEEAHVIQEVDGLTPGHVLQNREEKALLETALFALKPEHREILILKYVQDLSYEDIATLLQIPRGTVMSRLYHARTALRQNYLNLDGTSSRSETKEVT